MKIKCSFGYHTWSGCKCSACSTTRDEGHDWNADGEACATCGATRPNAHVWGAGNRCERCGIIATAIASGVIGNISPTGLSALSKAGQAAFEAHQRQLLDELERNSPCYNRRHKFVWAGNIGTCSVCGVRYEDTSTVHGIPKHIWDESHDQNHRG